MTAITPELMLEVMDEPICIHRCLLTLTKSITAALMLTYANYQMQDLPPEADGWFCKSQDEWLAELGLSRFEQEGARRLLRELGILEEKRVGMPAKLHFRVNGRKLLQLLGEQARSNFADSLKQAGRP